ncbi:MAG: methylase [Oceanospirillaceae bacterium]|nr:methylase [Oceanospirillaceae bacterium]MBT13534.1 methylase [Oceanospirillaceae bacterium]|tara:strand:+ start:90074 stop:90715 length:642 start_codon:yes stop_codon:yes gene_type:complete
MSDPAIVKHSVELSENNLPVAESCLRNQQAIYEVLSQELADDAVVLELGSGTGQHAAFMTPRLPRLRWQPSELAENIPAINAWREHIGRENFLPPLILDIAQDLWPVKQVDAVFSANLVHFVGWDKVRAMMAGIGRVLKPAGRAIFYGPYNYHGEFTSEGNRQLDEWLKSRDPSSGIKDFEQIQMTARKEKLRLLKDIAMPANNRILILQKYV